MDQATQQNAALVEESAAAADSLKTQAQQLVGAVAVFKVGGHEASNAPALAASPIAARSAVRPARPAARAALPLTGKPAHSPTAELPRRTGTDDDWQTF
jgi:dihydroxyacetone kinase